MCVLDIIFLIPVVWLAYRGFSKGLILSLTSLVALIAGIWFSIHFSGLVAGWLRNDMGFTSSYLHIISFIMTFTATVILIHLIGKLFNKVAEWAALGIINRLLGLLFGLMRAALYLGILIFIINSVDVKSKLITPELKNESFLFKPLSRVVPRIWPVVKEWLPKRIEEKKEDLPVIQI